MRNFDPFPISNLCLVLPAADQPSLSDCLIELSPAFRSRLYWAVEQGLAEEQVSGPLRPWTNLESGQLTYVLYLSSDNPESADLVSKIQELDGRVVIHPSLSRIWGDAADLCCLLSELESQLDHLLQHTISAEAREQVQEYLPEICDLLSKQTGLDFQRYRQAFVCRKIERRMVLTRKQTVLNYLAFLRTQPSECQSLFSELSVGVTEFFREPEGIELLRQQLLKKLETSPSLKVWCVGCSSGEEAYSVAIAALSVFHELGQPPDLKVMATDISDEALDIARSGTYPRADVQGKVEPHLFEQYFVVEGDNVRVSREVRQVCQFFKHDLTTEAPFPEIDLIVCRNVLIYLSAALLDKICPVFHYSLATGGQLLLGSAETLGDASVLFKVVEPGASLYAKLEGGGKFSPPSLPSEFSRKAGQLDLTAIVGRIVAEEFTPRSVVVNQQGAVVWSSGRLESLFRMGGGDFRNHVLALARPGLKNPLRSALMEASREQRTTVIQGVRIEASHDGPALFVDLTVQPMPDLGSELGLYWWSFRSVLCSPGTTPSPPKLQKLRPWSANSLG